MQRVIYTGPHTAVDLGGGVVAHKSKHTEVDDELAERLIARNDFRRAPTPKTPDPDPENDDSTGGDAGQQEE